MKTRIYKPTRQKLISFEKKCSKLPCQDPANDKTWNCNKCKISNDVEKFLGIRMEDVGEELIEIK